MTALTLRILAATRISKYLPQMNKGVAAANYRHYLLTFYRSDFCD